MTTLTLNLSQTLQTELSSKTSGSIWADAVYWGPNGNAHWTNLVSNSVVQNSGTLNITLPQMQGGKIYFLIGSEPSKVTSDPFYNYSTQTGVLINSQSDLMYVAKPGANPDTSAATNSYTFDSFEFSLQGRPGDVGNLTAVTGFGIPMGLNLSHTSAAPTTLQAAGYAVSGSTITGNFPSNTIYQFNGGPLSGQTSFAISPSSNNQTVYQSTDWKPYLDKLVQLGANFTTTLSEVAGVFNGAKDGQNVYQNGAFYNYTVTAGTYKGDSYFVFTPNNNSQTQGIVVISEAQLMKSIYSTAGAAQVYYQSPGSSNYVQFTPNITTAMANTGAGDAVYTQDGFTPSGNMSVGWNSQWGTIFTNFLSGLDGGLIGVKGISPNPNMTKEINLSASWNQAPTYAYGGSAINAANHANNTDTSSLGTLSQYYDKYAQAFFQNSNSYGSNYADAAMKNYTVGGPDLLIGQSSGGDLSQIKLTLYAQNETNVPAPSTGSPTANYYVTPVLNNYIAPTLPPNNGFDGYSPTSATLNASSLLQINMGLPASQAGSPNIGVLSTTSATLSIMDPNTGNWISVKLNPNSGFVQDLSYAPGAIGQNGTLTVSQDVNTTPPGEILIHGMPITTNGSYWFKLATSDASGHDKNYNLYVTTGTSPNTPFSGANEAVDGGALVSPNSNGNTLVVNLNSGSNISMDANTVGLPQSSLSSGTYAINGTPTAPVAGLLLGGANFSANAITTNGGDSSGQGSTDTTPKVTITTAELPQLAFGWTGLNDVQTAPNVYNASSWIGGYTNKVSSEATVVVVISTSATNFDLAHRVAYATAIATPDGQWATSNWYNPKDNSSSSASSLLKAGTYYVVMEEFGIYTPSLDFTHPVGAPSDILKMTVANSSSSSAVATSVPVVGVNSSAASSHSASDPFHTI